MRTLLSILTVLTTTVFATTAAFTYIPATPFNSVTLAPRSIPLDIAWTNPTAPNGHTYVNVHRVVLATGHGSKLLIKDLLRGAYVFATSELRVHYNTCLIHGHINHILHPGNGRPVLPRVNHHHLAPDLSLHGALRHPAIQDAHAPPPVPDPSYLPSNRFHFTSVYDPRLRIMIYGRISWSVLCEALAALEDYMQRWNVWGKLRFDVRDEPGNRVARGVIKWDDENYYHVGLGPLRRERLQGVQVHVRGVR